jgi:hypothetical protein
LHWLGLLFATLASGFQCSDLPRKERQIKSQVYSIKCQIPISVFFPDFRNSCLCVRMSPNYQLSFPSKYA